jgi:hypothetical protein
MQIRCLFPVLLIVRLWTSHGQDYAVRPALLLDEVARQCDLIVKVQALRTEAVDHAAFPDHTGAGFSVDLG